MNCKVCGSQLPPGADFCNHCGAKAEYESKNHCKNCGTEMRAGAMFCPGCGMSVTPTPPRRERDYTHASTGNNSATIIIVVLILIIALMSSLIVGFMIFNSNDDNENIVATEVPSTDDETDDNNQSETEYEIEYEEEPEPTAVITTPPPTPIPQPPVANSGEFFPSDRQYITTSDLQGKSQTQVAYMRNEIYARHGYIFQSEPFKSYFSAKSWYRPNPYFSESQFNSIEAYNKSFIVEYEQSMGWR